MYKTVIWASDGSDGADAALREALRFAEAGGRIVALHCDQRLNGRASAWPVLADEEDRRAKITCQVEELKGKGIEIELDVRRSHREAADVVAAAAAEHRADVIVCGTRGHSALTGAFLGSFTHRLLHIAPCPVLAVGPRSELVCSVTPERARHRRMRRARNVRHDVEVSAAGRRSRDRRRAGCRWLRERGRDCRRSGDGTRSGHSGPRAGRGLAANGRADGSGTRRPDRRCGRYRP